MHTILIKNCSSMILVQKSPISDWRAEIYSLGLCVCSVCVHVYSITIQIVPCTCVNSGVSETRATSRLQFYPVCHSIAIRLISILHFPLHALIWKNAIYMLWQFCLSWHSRVIKLFSFHLTVTPLCLLTSDIKQILNHPGSKTDIKYQQFI